MNPLTDAQVETFVTQQLDVTSQAGPEQERIPSEPSIVQYCFVQLTRSAFRRTRIDDESANDVRRKLEGAIAARKPITLAVPFGGYKNYRAASFPGPDWAEIFNMNYLARYVLPLARCYEPGVILQYTYSSGVMDLVSNIPAISTATYMEQFRSLLSIFAKRIPANLRMTAVDISGHYPGTELMEELRRNYEDNRARWGDKFSSDERSRRIGSAERNLMRVGAVDLASLSEAEWSARCIDAAMWCEALDGLTLRRRFNKYSENIQLVFVRGPSLSVHIGSCDTSAHHFWSGSGVLELRGDRLQQRILSGEKLSFYKQEGLVREVPVKTVLSAVSSTFDLMTVLKLDPNA